MLQRMVCWLLKPGVGLPSRALFGSTAKGRNWERLGNPMYMGTYP